MSADAKVWQDDDEHWRAVHDGECLLPEGHYVTSYELNILMSDVARCMGLRAGLPLRWVLYVYANGQPGLKGYVW